MDTLDLLLKMDVPNAPEQEVKQLRLSQLASGDVIFKLRGMTYNRVAEITKQHSEEYNVHIVLAGVVSPDLKSAGLLEKYGAATPADLVKKMLLPGEIEDLSRSIEKLSGYRMDTLAEVKKNKHRS